MRARTAGTPWRYDDDFRGLVAGAVAVPVPVVAVLWGAEGARGAGILLLGCGAFLISSVIYLVWTHLLFARTPPERLRRIAGAQHRRGSAALLRLAGFGSAENVAVSAAGVALVVAIAAAVVGSGSGSPLLPVLVLLTAACAWITVVYAFALRYLRLDAAGERIDFDIAEQPCFGDFVSMAVMISAVGALSAGTPRSRTGLRAVRTHTAIAFGFNALVVAMTVSILTGVVTAAG